MTTNEVIRKLKGLDLSLYPYNEVLSLVREFQYIKVICLTIRPGAIISRIRKGIGFKSRDELSYPPVANCHICQRANLPNHTMFYGTISDSGTPTDDNRTIAISECSSLAREGKQSKGKEHFTISNWLNTKPLRVATIVDDTVFDKISNNTILQEAKERFVECKSNPGYYEFARFVASEFSKPVKYDYEYLISATIADEYVHQPYFDGIMYPSVRMGGQAGMNIALKPGVTHQSLALQNAGELVYYKNGDKGIVVVDKVINLQDWSYFDTKPTTEVILQLIGESSLDEIKDIQ